jgi:uncharacterized protein
MRQDGKIDYVEMPGGDLPVQKAFYTAAFGWGFTDYGPSYAAYDQGLDGGFDADADSAVPLIVLYATDLEAMEAKVRAAGGVVVKAAYNFPGGRRFHFRDPAGNVLAVWSEA